MCEVVALAALEAVEVVRPLLHASMRELSGSAVVPQAMAVLAVTGLALGGCGHVGAPAGGCNLCMPRTGCDEVGTAHPYLGRRVAASFASGL